MKHVFPSHSWVEAYKNALNASADYKDAASTWDHGAIALAVDPEPERGLPEGFCVLLDVEKGVCRGAHVIPLSRADEAPFTIRASYQRWTEVLSNRLDPIVGMVTRRLALRGSLVTMMRYVRSAKAMVHCATLVPSEFLPMQEKVSC
jgi:putative sterol carrier protein